jgi:hypothetical protein
MRIQLAGAVCIVLAGSTFGLNQYTEWRSNSLGPQLQAWAPGGLDTPQLEVDASWQRSQSAGERVNEAHAQLGPVEPGTKLAPPSGPSPSADPVSRPTFDPALTAAPQQKPTSSEPPREGVAQPGLGAPHLEDVTRERPVRVASASSPSPGADLIPVSSPALDPPLSAGPPQKPTPSEPLGEWVTTVSAIDQGGAPISARNHQQTKPQPQRDRSARKQIDSPDQGLMANVVGNITDGLSKAWSSVQVWK